MNIEYILKHVKLVLWGIVVAFVAQIFLVAQAHADGHVEREEQLDELASTLNEVGFAVSNSPDLTQRERLDLLTQLVELSRAIMVLRNAEIDESVRDSQAGVVGESLLLLEDIGLHRVTMEFDLADETAVITEYYTDDSDDLVSDPFGVTYTTNVRTVTLPNVPGVRSFADTISYYKDQLVADLAQELGLDPLLLGGATFPSARNPERNTRSFAFNSPEARELSSDFGNRSIISNVVVFPSDGYTRVQVHSDQEEVMSFELIRDRQETATQAGEYSYAISYYADVLGSSLRPNTNLRSGEVSPLVQDSASEVTEAEALEFITTLFAEIPFTDSLRSADEQLFAFLIENEAVYQLSGTDIDYNALTAPYRCVNRGDALILDEYILQLLAGLRSQYILDQDLVRYIAPLELQSGTGSSRSGCRNQEKFF